MEDSIFLDKEQDMLLCFNKVSGALFSTTQIEEGSDFKMESMNHDHFGWKLLKFNPCTHEWRGTIATGGLVNKGELLPRLTETGANQQCATKIEKEYRIHKQVNILHNVVSLLISKGIIEESEVDEFLDMRDYIERTRNNHEAFMKARKDSELEEFVTIEEEAQQLADCLAGGLNVIVGRI